MYQSVRDAACIKTEIMVRGWEVDVWENDEGEGVG